MVIPQPAGWGYFTPAYSKAPDATPVIPQPAGWGYFTPAYSKAADASPVIPQPAGWGYFTPAYSKAADAPPVIPQPAGWGYFTPAYNGTARRDSCNPPTGRLGIPCYSSSCFRRVNCSRSRTRFPSRVAPCAVRIARAPRCRPD